MVDSKKRQHPFESNLSDTPGIRLVPKEPGQHPSDKKAPRTIDVNSIRNKKSVVKRIIEYLES